MVVKIQTFLVLITSFPAKSYLGSKKQVQKGGETILISQAEVKNGAAPSRSSNGSIKKNGVNKSLKRY